MFQVLLNILALWLIHRLGTRLLGPLAGLCAAVLWALYLPAYYSVVNVTGDQLATVVLLCAGLSYERAWRTNSVMGLAFAGSLFGLASLCRSACVAFGVAAGLTWLFAHGIHGLVRRIPGGAALAGGTALALIPWAIRNHRVFDRVVVGSTLSGYNLLRHNSPVEGEQLYHFVAAGEGQRYLNAFMASHPELTGHENEAEMNALYSAAGRKLITAHPTRYVKLSLYRFLPLWFNWRVNDAYGKPMSLFDHVMTLQQVILLALLLLGLWRRFNGRPAIAIGVLLYCLLYMAVVARLRFLVPAMPMVMIGGAAFLGRLFGAQPNDALAGGTGTPLDTAGAARS